MRQVSRNLTKAALAFLLAFFRPRPPAAVAAAAGSSHPPPAAHTQITVHEKMASTTDAGDESLYPIAVLIDELRNDDVQVSSV